MPGQGWGQVEKGEREMNEERLNELTDERLQDIERIISDHIKGNVSWDAYDDFTTSMKWARERNELEVKLAETEDSVVKAIGLHQTVVAERDALKGHVEALTKGGKGNTAYYKRTADYQRKEADTLRASNAALREALTAAKDAPMKWKTKKPFEIFSEISDICDKALAHTPADSLTEYRNEVLEEAAKEIEDPKHMSNFQCEKISRVAAAIRAMRTDNDTD